MRISSIMTTLFSAIALCAPLSPAPVESTLDTRSLEERMIIMAAEIDSTTDYEEDKDVLEKRMIIMAAEIDSTTDYDEDEDV